MRPGMHRASLATAFTVALLASGCSPMRVNSYEAPAAHVGRYHTYEWAATDTASTGDPRLDNNRFFDERVRVQVDRHLASRGFEKVTASPDLIVHYHVSVTQEIDVQDLDGQYSNGSAVHGRSTVFDKGTLFLDFVEAGGEGLVWRGWAEGSIDGVIDNQAWMETRIDEAVAQILKRLPNRL